MFRTIGSFLKEAVLGVAEMLGATFTSNQRKAVSSDTGGPLDRAFFPGDAAGRAATLGRVEVPAPADPAAASSAPPAENSANRRTPRPPPAAKPSLRAKSASPRKKVASVPAAANECEAVASLPAGDQPSEASVAPESRSRVALRYQALKAAGLSAKEANDFSRSEKKYALYQRLSSTHLPESAKTQWEALKEFDLKAADEAARRKGEGVPVEDLRVLKKQIAKARSELIARYQPGEASGGNTPSEVETVAKMIGLEHF
ncbi:hypothetical protein [Methylocapsa palsarum]|uniref:Uncharacterized protein n=1 Tax=Methylocapsa palsarum TaxID=1612308 RepID=A0A1I4ADB5_9HYPH|nr:hypothetical protein [Methylocapsa palsarum]SFK54334.1 hypothetical protein SAMN05444581_11022 [Methylocapsa palsarum]